ncbi:unnamed protein product, partial [Medioppia subpectinata]
RNGLSPFSTPNYPLRKGKYESCSYWIRAPIDHTVEVTFDDFSFGQPFTGEEKHGISGLCLDESVEIRNLDDIYNGNIYCGEQIEPQTVMTSTQRDFIIIIIADDQMRGRGLKANVKFIEKEETKQLDLMIGLNNGQKLKQLDKRIVTLGRRKLSNMIKTSFSSDQKSRVKLMTTIFVEISFWKFESYLKAHSLCTLSVGEGLRQVLLPKCTLFCSGAPTNLGIVNRKRQIFLAVNLGPISHHLFTESPFLWSKLEARVKGFAENITDFVSMYGTHPFRPWTLGRAVCEVIHIHIITGGRVTRGQFIDMTCEVIIANHFVDSVPESSLFKVFVSQRHVWRLIEESAVNDGHEWELNDTKISRFIADQFPGIRSSQTLDHCVLILGVVRTANGLRESQSSQC